MCGHTKRKKGKKKEPKAKQTYVRHLAYGFQMENIPVLQSRMPFTDARYDRTHDKSDHNGHFVGCRETE